MIAIRAIALLLFVLRVADVAAKLELNDQQKDVLRETVKSLLDFRHVPGSSPSKLPSSAANNAEKYMELLLRKFKMSTLSPMTIGNTVRSITPRAGELCNRSVLQFSLNVVKPTEQLIRAELHFNLRKFGSKRPKKRNLLRCFAIVPKKRSCVPDTATPIELPIVDQSSNWLSFNVRDVLTLLIARKSRSSQSQPLSVSCGHSRRPHPDSVDSGDVRFSPSPRLILIGEPFLLISSVAENFIDVGDDVGTNEALQNIAAVDSNNDVHTRKRRDLYADPAYYQYSVGSANSTDRSWTDSDNREEWLPHVRAFQEKGPDGLIARQRTQKSGAQRGEIPRGRYGGKKFGAVNKKKKQKEKHIPSAWQQPAFDAAPVSIGPFEFGLEPPALFVLHPERNQELCARHDLVVEFADIGWGDWIISPKSFEAHYCSGSCFFPLTRKTNPTNHAMIQAIIHRIGLHPNVPLPCCAADKMDSLTLLYFDEDQNVVLKNYPKMTVKSCGCL